MVEGCGGESEVTSDQREKQVTRSSNPAASTTFGGFMEQELDLSDKEKAVLFKFRESLWTDMTAMDLANNVIPSPQRSKELLLNGLIAIYLEGRDKTIKRKRLKKQPKNTFRPGGRKGMI